MVLSARSACLMFSVWHGSRQDTVVYHNYTDKYTERMHTNTTIQMDYVMNGFEWQQNKRKQKQNCNSEKGTERNENETEMNQKQNGNGAMLNAVSQSMIKSSNNCSTKTKHDLFIDAYCSIQCHSFFHFVFYQPHLHVFFWKTFFFVYMWLTLHKPPICNKNIEIQFIVSCSFRILADNDNIFVFIIRLIILKWYNVMHDTVEKVNFDKLAMLVSSVITFTCLDNLQTTQCHELYSCKLLSGNSSIQLLWPT